MTNKPNIVFLITDDTNFDRLGCYGGRFPTPNIDRLAREGVCFYRFFCGASICTPSRWEYLTGQFADRCRSRGFQHSNTAGEAQRVIWNTSMETGMPSMGRYLTEAGYRTGYFGKWHVGSDLSAYAALRRYEHADLEDPEVDAALRAYQAAAVDAVKRTGGFTDAGGIHWGNNEGFPIERLRHHNLDWVSQCALDFLDAGDPSQPFCLWVAATAIHGPPHEYSLEQDARYTHGGKLAQTPTPHGTREDVRRRVEEVGLRWMHWDIGPIMIDDQAGAVLRKLDALGVADNTIVVWCTDHNIEPGKGTCYDQGMHIPCVVRWPGVAAPGGRCAVMAQNVDWLPTVASACGLDLPSDVICDGVDLTPAIRDDAAAREYVFGAVGYTRAVYDGRYKYIAFRYPDSLARQITAGELSEAPNHMDLRTQGQPLVAREQYPAYWSPDQLYDVAADPLEQRNLAGDPSRAGVLARLRAVLAEHLATYEEPFDLEHAAGFEMPDFDALTRKAAELPPPGWWSGKPYRDFWFSSTGEVVKTGDGKREDGKRET